MTAVLARLRWPLAIVGAVLAFALVILSKGVSPIDAYRSLWLALTTTSSVTAVLVKSTPLILAALAVTIPAKAGMVKFAVDRRPAAR